MLRQKESSVIHGESSHNPWVPDAKCQAAGALHLCLNGSTLGGNAAHILSTVLDPAGNLEALPIHPWHADWRLEVICALGGLLPPGEALMNLVPLVSPAFCSRVQHHALMSIYTSGVKSCAPDSVLWRSAVQSVSLDVTLLSCVARWHSWAQQVEVKCATADLGGRYILAEALRCISRFSSPSTVAEATRLIGMSHQRELYCGPGWRGRFYQFVERRRRCPITSPQSPF